MFQCGIHTQDALSADSPIEMRAKGMTTVARRLTSEGRAGGSDSAPQVLVHPDDVVRRLKAFIEVCSGKRWWLITQNIHIGIIKFMLGKRLGYGIILCISLCISLCMSLLVHL